MSWSFVLTSLVICVSPGIGALYTMAAGLARGTRAGLLAAFACTLGTVPHAVAALTAGSVRDRVLTRPALVTRHPQGLRRLVPGPERPARGPVALSPWNNPADRWLNVA